MDNRLCHAMVMSFPSNLTVDHSHKRVYPTRDVALADTADFIDTLAIRSTVTPSSVASTSCSLKQLEGGQR